jgi:hypothetical protein
LRLVYWWQAVREAQALYARNPTHQARNEPTSSNQEISFLAFCRQVAGGTASAREKSTDLATLPD